MIIHALYILKIHFQVVGIDFASNHLIKLKVFRDGRFCTSYHSQVSVIFFFFYLYIYSPDPQESDGDAIHRVGNYLDLLPEMPRYCCPLVI